MILDGMWTALNFQDLGAACGSYKCSGVVSRSRDLALIGADNSIEIEPLWRDEGWALLESVAFKGGHATEDLKERARKI